MHKTQYTFLPAVFSDITKRTKEESLDSDIRVEETRQLAPERWSWKSGSPGGRFVINKTFSDKGGKHYLGVTASAYAANPFSDVPAGHWAYDSVAKLAAAGVIDGYGDTTFKGDRLMTRYEMAQIVAKAMAKGANVDKLAAEFADELDALGVRVAALEKKSDNVKITGQIRYS